MSKYRQDDDDDDDEQEHDEEQEQDEQEQDEEAPKWFKSAVGALEKRLDQLEARMPAPADPLKALEQRLAKLEESRSRALASKRSKRERSRLKVRPQRQSQPSQTPASNSRTPEKHTKL